MESCRQAGFIFVTLALYDLLKGVNRRCASLMVTLVIVSIPIAFLNKLNSIAVLVLVLGLTSYPYLKSLSGMLWLCCSLNLHIQGVVVVDEHPRSAS
jgi:hypothetical protein